MRPHQLENQRTLTAKMCAIKKPPLLVEKAVKGMLPKTKLIAELFRNLNVVEFRAQTRCTKSRKQLT
jgi:ribosomal protein L13